MEKKDTRGWKFYERHIQYFLDKDIDGLVANDYTEDALCISYDFAVKGREGLKQLFTAYLGLIGEFSVIETTHFQETDDAIILEANLKTEKAGIRKVYDCFTMRNGKIAYHFTGLKD